MKNIYTIIISILFTATLWAQAPQKMSYQAVIRNNSNALITSSPVGMQISILQGSTTGSVVYAETQTPNTNANGLVSLVIGNGTVVTGTFVAINWANGPYFIKTETDPTGGTAYTISGTSELLSVPYALHAKTAEGITGGITETDPLFVSSPANGITSSNITNWNSKLDAEVDGSVTNEIQAISIGHDTIYLSNGGYAKLPIGFDGNYNSLTNKPTNVSTFTNDAGYLTSFTEVDGSVTNELQTLRISNDTIYLSNGGFAKLPTINGSETKINAGTNINVIGSGTTGSPYIIGVSKPKFYLGKDTLGGIVYYIFIGNDGNQHGLIVSKTETSSVTWGGATIVGADRTEDGVYNMNLMPTGAGTARTWVESFGAGWYLPSIDELNFLWHNRYHVNKTARAGGLTLLSTGANYWSSSEWNASSSLVFIFNGGNSGFSNKANTYSVRAIRSF